MPGRRRLRATFDRRGQTIRVRIRTPGVRHTFTVETTDLRAAERVAADKIAELEREAARRAAGLVTGSPMSSLLEHFARVELPQLAEGTREAYNDSLKPLRTYFVDTIGDPAVDRIRARHVMDYLAWRRTHRLAGGDALANRTLAKDRAVLHRIFALADRMEWRDGNPAARVPAPKADPRDPVILTDAQFAKLIEACEGRPMLELFALTLGESGARCESEALWLQWDDVHLEDGFIRVASGRGGHRTKSGKGRWVPMTERLAAAMRKHFRRYRFATYGGKQTPWIFHHDRVWRGHPAGTRIKSLRASFRAAAERAKIPAEFHQHDLRHRRVTTWLAAGKSPVAVKEAMGHSDLRTTMGYAHLAREHLRELIAEPPAPRKTARKRRA